MKKHLIIIMTIAAAIAIAFAGCNKDKEELPVVASGTAGKCTWTLAGTAPNYTLTIGGNGAMENYGDDATPWNSYEEDIKTVIIQDGVTTVGVGAFRGCVNLTSVTLGNSVITIDEEAFEGCEYLASINIPNSVKTISSEALKSCHSLVSIDIPNSVTTIGVQAFAYCSGLTAINVDAGNANYASENGVMFNKSKTTLIFYPQSKTGSSYAIPNSVTTIGDLAFADCTGLSGALTIPNSVKIIGEQAFYGCSGFTAVTIGNSVTTIGSYAFSDCTGLTTVTNQRTTPQSIREYTFTNANNITLKVPSSAVSAYESADVWKDFKEIVSI